MTAPQFHPSLKLAWSLAGREAHLSGSPTIEPFHFLVGLLLVMDDYYLREAKAMGLTPGAIEETAILAAAARRSTGITGDQITAIRRSLTRRSRRETRAPGPVMLPRSANSRVLFRDAESLAAAGGRVAVDVVHLLEALLKSAHAPGSATPGERFAALVSDLRPQADQSPDVPGRKLPGSAGATPLLDELGRDLTVLARAGRLPPVVGRKKEMTALARHLLRTTKRNVLIIGEAGVGKTAVVEGFAQKIAAGQAPGPLRSLRVVQVNVSDLVAGTRHRGDMESRIQQVIREATDDPNLVLFLDEMHLVVKAGSGEGAPMDIATILKPVLSRDDFRCIGATTVDEYERHIKADAALLRRFQILRVPEPSAEDALQICAAWARRVELRQGVVFAEDAVPAAVELSTAFIRDRLLPDKAIDLLENAAVLVKVSSLSSDMAPTLQPPPTITREHVAAVIEEQYGVAVRRSEFLDAAGIESALRAEIVGQSRALDALAQEIAALGAEADAGEKPIGVFLFTGPTGTGKTFTAECLGKAAFGHDRNAVARFNMNEYKERHELARLIGAPPGFVGHGHPGALFRFAEANPRGMIILDEMEKAHPEIQDYFLQIFDKGEASDSRGREVDFRSYLFVMTCNLAAGRATPADIGFGAGRGAVADGADRAGLDAVAEHFRPEFIARIRRVIVFREFSREDYLTLLERRIAAVAGRLEREHSVSFRVSDAAKSGFTDLCADQAAGCRGFERLFERLVFAPVLASLHDVPPQGGVTLAGFADGKPVLRFGGHALEGDKPALLASTINLSRFVK